MQAAERGESNWDSKGSHRSAPRFTAGCPRPTFLQFEDDPACAADCDDLMLGPFLLAAPVVQPGERTRSVYLPAGTTVTIPAPLEHLPLLAAAGASLPMTQVVNGISRLP